MTKPFRPMLACRVTDLSAVTYPVMATPKLDGIRAVIRDGKALSRSLKPIPNVHVREYLEAGALEGCDGELMLPAPATFQRITSAFMTERKVPPADWCFHVFDWSGGGTAIQRWQYAKIRSGSHVSVLRPVVCYHAAQVEQFEELCLAQGHEGVVLRDPGGPYKHGRSTLKEGYLLKVKRFQDGEAEVIGAVELMRNTNEAETSELGLTKRSHAKAGKVAGGILGALQVRDLVSGVEFEIGTGFTEAQRRGFWARRSALVGQIAKYKHFVIGSMDKPRHPVWLGWRSREDMSDDAG